MVVFITTAVIDSDYNVVCNDRVALLLLLFLFLFVDTTGSEEAEVIIPHPILLLATFLENRFS